MIIYHSKDYQRGPTVLFWPKALTFTKQENAEISHVLLFITAQ